MDKLTFKLGVSCLINQGRLRIFRSGCRSWARGVSRGRFTGSLRNFARSRVCRRICLRCMFLHLISCLSSDLRFWLGLGYWQIIRIEFLLDIRLCPGDRWFGRFCESGGACHMASLFRCGLHGEISAKVCPLCCRSSSTGEICCWRDCCWRDGSWRELIVRC